MGNVLYGPSPYSEAGQRIIFRMISISIRGSAKLVVSSIRADNCRGLLHLKEASVARNSTLENFMMTIAAETKEIAGLPYFTRKYMLLLQHRFVIARMAMLTIF